MTSYENAKILNARVQSIEFKQHGDDRGMLIAIEAGSDEVPFLFNRCYYIFNTSPDVERGQHAHKLLRQVLVCVNGECTIECETPDGRIHEYRLDAPNKGLWIEGLVWRVMKQFTADAVLMVLASDRYDESDYIRNYETFKLICQEVQHG